MSFAEVAVRPLRAALASRTFLAGAVLAAIALVIPVASGAAPYAVTSVPNAPYTPLPIAGGTYTNVGTGSDTAFRVNLPFSFTFFDVPYTSVNIGTNGYVTFGAGNNGNAYSNWALPGTSNNPKDLIAVWWSWADCRNLPDAIRSQTIGTAPNRQFVVEWNCTCWAGKNSTWQAQLWFTEGSTTIATHYGSYPTPSDYDASHNLTIGIQNQTATEYYLGLGCNKCSSSVWPTNTKVSYSQGPELSVTSVRTPTEGYAGVPMHVEATVGSVGGKPALGFTTRFWVSTSRTLTDAAILLGTVSGSFNAEPGVSVEFTMDPRLPISLEPGTYYILAEADPFHAVPMTGRGASVGASPPFTIGLPAPNLAPTRIRAPDRIAPGSTFRLDWSADNIGNASAIHAPYVVVLSTHDLPGPASRVIFEGLVDVEMLGSTRVADDVTMPGDVAAGSYFIGVIIDPDDRIFEHEKGNNTGVSSRVLVADDAALSIATLALPAAELGAPYAVALQAAGGDGIYVWSVAAGTRLPPGLALVETPAGARELGLPFSTTLEGAPNALGELAFALQVDSAGLTATRDFQLEVGHSSVPLQLTVFQLPQATFGASYVARMSALGGLSPYSWSIVSGSLPAGLLLEPDGWIGGKPRQDGIFHPTVRVTDARGASIERELALAVTPPGELACSTERLPTHALGVPYDEVLHVAGGIRPIVWKTLETRFLAGGYGEETATRLGEAPPGLLARTDGRITGAPSRAGAYLWTFDVSDSSGRQPIACTVFLEVQLDQGLTVSSQALPNAVVDQLFVAQLEATGGNGKLSWSLVPGNTLPAGLTLDATGRIEGTPSGAQLDGEPSRAFSFLMRVADPHNRTALAPLTITVMQPREFVSTKDETTRTTGCQAGVTDPSLLAMGASLGLSSLLRRRPKRAVGSR